MPTPKLRHPTKKKSQAYTNGERITKKNITSYVIKLKPYIMWKIKRNYYALVHGQPIAGNTIDKPIGRHPKNRLLFCVKEGGREAITHFKVHKKFKNFSLLDVSLETGRTHQIRVHSKHCGNPIIGDRKYGNLEGNCQRLCLHAMRLSFEIEGLKYKFCLLYTSPSPRDRQK